MDNNNQISTAQKLALSLGAVIAGWAVKKTLETGYEKVFKEAAPDKPESDQAMPMLKVATWTMISGLAVSAVKTFVKRKGGQKLMS